MSGPEKTSALFTDLYELTMAQAYRATGMSGTAVFEAYFRTLPPGRSYVLSAGLQDVLDYLSALRFEKRDIDYLRSLGSFAEDFLVSLEGMRFTGSVWAMPEGTAVFPNEPIVQVVAPLSEGQLVETFVLNQIHLQSLIASKAARVVEAAGARPVVDFGSRRAHGTDAAIKVARASYIAGVTATSNLQAARRYGIPPSGTMAHSYVQAFGDEAAAFEVYNRLFPGTTLLVDTYDTLEGVDRVIELAGKLGPRFAVGAIRLDSGDLAALAKGARRKLDAAGLGQVRIVASSGLDEYKVAALVAADAPVDVFGVGTAMVTSKDAPTLDLAYKLVEYEGVGRTKFSPGKVLYPGRKQVFRRVEAGVLLGDTVGRFDEDLPGEPLLVPVMEAGRILPHVDLGLESAQRRARDQIASLPPALRRLEAPPQPYPIEISPTLHHDLEQLRSQRAAP